MGGSLRASAATGSRGVARTCGSAWNCKSTGAQETSLLQVSNGRFLWSDVKLPTGRSITRLDLRQLRSDSLQAATELAAIQPGQATWSPVRPELTAFAGGLPTLLASLCRFVYIHAAAGDEAETRSAARE